MNRKAAMRVRGDSQIRGTARGGGRRLLGGVVCALLAGVLALLAAPGAVAVTPGAPVAAAAGQVAAGQVHAGHLPGQSAAGHVAQDDSRQPSDETAPAGPRLDPSDEADSNLAQNKAIVAAIAAVLLAIVLYGRHVRKKRRNSS